MQLSVHVRVVLLIVCVQVFGEKYISTAKAIANDRLDPDIANYRVKNSANPLMERINQIRATLMSLLQYKISKLQQQIVPLYAPTNAMMPPFSPLQQLPRPYIAQALIAPPPTQLGAMWLAQAGIVVPQSGSSTATTQPLVFRPIAQFAFAPTAQQLAAAAAAPIAAQMGANPISTALAATIPRPQLGLTSLVPATGSALPFTKPPIGGLSLALPGSPVVTSQISPGVNLGQPVGATLPITKPGAALGQPLGATIPTTQQGPALGQPLGATIPTTLPGEALGQPLGATIPTTQQVAAIGQPFGATIPTTQPGVALGQPLGTTLPTAPPGASLGQPLGATLPTTQPGAGLGLPSIPIQPTTQPGSTPQDEQIVNVVPVPQPGATPPVPQPALSQGTLPSSTQTTQPITATEPAISPSAQFDERTKPKALLLV